MMVYWTNIILYTAGVFLTLTIPTLFQIMTLNNSIKIKSEPVTTPKNVPTKKSPESPESPESSISPIKFDEIKFNVNQKKPKTINFNFDKTDDEKKIELTGNDDKDKLALKQDEPNKTDDDNDKIELKQDAPNENDDEKKIELIDLTKKSLFVDELSKQKKGITFMYLFETYLDDLYLLKGKKRIQLGNKQTLDVRLSDFSTQMNHYLNEKNNTKYTIDDTELTNAANKVKAQINRLKKKSVFFVFVTEIYLNLANTQWSELWQQIRKKYPDISKLEDFDSRDKEEIKQYLKGFINLGNTRDDVLFPARFTKWFQLVKRASPEDNKITKISEAIKTFDERYNSYFKMS